MEFEELIKRVKEDAIIDSDKETIYSDIDLYSKKRLSDETNYLKSYFSTDDGLLDLIHFYFFAETYKLREPTGILHREKNELEFFLEPSEKVKSYFEAVYSADSEQIQAMINDLTEYEELLTRFGNEDYSSYIRIQIDKLKEYMGGNRSLGPDLLIFVYDHASSRSVLPDKSNDLDILIHIHPNRISITKDETTEMISIPAKGYSPFDKLASLDKSLALIEYESDNGIYDGVYRLDINMSLSHRICLKEGSVGNLELSIEPNTTKVVGMDSKSVEIDTPHFLLSKPLAYETLMHSPKVLPLIRAYDIDPIAQAKEETERLLSKLISSGENLDGIDLDELRQQFINNQLKVMTRTKRVVQRLLNMAWREKS
jgi:hypothetical protein